MEYKFTAKTLRKFCDETGYSIKEAAKRLIQGLQDPTELCKDAVPGYKILASGNGDFVIAVKDNFIVEIDSATVIPRDNEFEKKTELLAAVAELEDRINELFVEIDELEDEKEKLEEQLEDLGVELDEDEDEDFYDDDDDFYDDDEDDDGDSSNEAKTLLDLLLDSITKDNDDLDD